MSERLVAMGVDGARAGWVAARLYEDRETGRRRTDLKVFEDIAEIAAVRADGAVVAIDIPIGLTDDGAPRTCDVEARKLLGARRSSVFPAPSRWMLDFVDDYPGLQLHVVTQAGAGIAIKSISRQGHAIIPKIAEVDRWLAANPEADDWLVECHPEVSFMALNRGRPMGESKKTTEGKRLRRDALAQVFPDAAVQLDQAAEAWRRTDVAIDDLHDAYACLHSALAPEHLTLGDGQRDRRGRPMRMVAARIDEPVARPARADIVLRPTTVNDLEFVLAAERDPEARPFVSNSTADEHRALIESPAGHHLIVEAGGEPAGFIMFAVDEPHETVELARLVVTKRGDGIGQRALALAVDHVFATTTAHRLWLDVLPRNARARRLYTATGFTEEGTLRDAWIGPEGRESLVIMSILRPEWASRLPA